ncbi:PEP-utilizing enzyme [Nanoarchaeota archaeon]
MNGFNVLQERANQSMLIPWPLCRNWVTNVKEVVGNTLEPLYMTYKDGYLCIVVQEDIMTRLVKSGVDRVRKDPLYVKKLIKKFEKGIAKLNAFTKKVFESDLSAKSNKELFGMYKTYFDLYYNVYIYGEPITWPLRFDFVKELEQEVAKKIKDKKKLHSYVSVLITPDEPSFINKEEEELLRMMLEIKKDDSLVRLFKKPVQTIMQVLPVEYQKLDQKLTRHAENYCWIPYDYESSLWDKEHFIKTIRQHIVKDLDIQGKLDKLVNQSADIRKKKKEILKELKLSPKLKKYFEAIADSGYLLDLKKEKHTISHYHMKKWVEEVAKKLNITVKQLRFMLLEDLEDALLHNRIDTRELDERREYSVFVLRREGTEALYKDDAKKIFQKFQTKIDAGKTEINGMCAQPGTVRGVARVLLSAADGDQMQEDEVLITSMTTPDFVPAMKKAGAIVTDEGGVTCHAAIVSRELGTPCVVGTKMATKFFKTGDLIEIHAASGIVRKLGS